MTALPLGRGGRVSVQYIGFYGLFSDGGADGKEGRRLLCVTYFPQRLCFEGRGKSLLPPRLFKQRETVHVRLRPPVFIDQLSNFRGRELFDGRFEVTSPGQPVAGGGSRDSGVALVTAESLCPPSGDTHLQRGVRSEPPPRRPHPWWFQVGPGLTHRSAAHHSQRRWVPNP